MAPNLKPGSRLALLSLATMVVPLALYAAPASARVDVGINLGFPAIVAPPPVVYAPPPVVYAAPPVVYAPAPVVVRGGYWWSDRYGHRHWRRR